MTVQTCHNVNILEIHWLLDFNYNNCVPVCMVNYSYIPDSNATAGWESEARFTIRVYKGEKLETWGTV